MLHFSVGSSDLDDTWHAAEAARQLDEIFKWEAAGAERQNRPQRVGGGGRDDVQILRRTWRGEDRLTGADEGFHLGAGPQRNRLIMSILLSWRHHYGARLFGENLVINLNNSSRLIFNKWRYILHIAKNWIRDENKINWIAYWVIFFQTHIDRLKDWHIKHWCSFFLKKKKKKSLYFMGN